MNKKAVFWFEFHCKRFRPGPSSVELQLGKKACIRHTSTSEVIVLISIASDVASQKVIWQEYYWNFLFDILFTHEHRQAQYNKRGWRSLIFHAKSLVLPFVEAIHASPTKKEFSVTQDKFTSSNIFSPKFAGKRLNANGMEISSIVSGKTKKFMSNKIPRNRMERRFKVNFSGFNFQNFSQPEVVSVWSISFPKFWSNAKIDEVERQKCPK